MWSHRCYRKQDDFLKVKLLVITSMHSSGMRTAYLLTIFQHALGWGDVYPSMHWAGGGLCLPGGCMYAQGVSAWGCLPRGGGVCPGEGVSVPGPCYLYLLVLSLTLLYNFGAL